MMKTKVSFRKTFSKFLVAAALLCSFSVLATGQALAADPAPGADPAATKYSLDCNGDNKPDANCNIISKYLNPFIRVLTVMVAIAVVIGIIVGGIQYSSSAGDPQKAAAAKDRIRNSIIAFIFFLFLYALLRFLIPGGDTIK
ncbi:MAG TPA: hypothetical protein VF572_05910 [Candidatus Saccharimonadales bacterium]|jgi:hypothetical protein